MEKLPFFIHGMSISDQAAAGNVGAEHRLRKNWLSNRIFKSYDDIVAHCCDAWRKLESQPWCIMSIGRREWTHGF